ncbi:MAG: GNAT family N-acetyltransferase [Propionicimonas sp.]|uniref:GNAT family N-acetyltransferase n=1 Tax=Propionicimonas sp. TaxID=1955623 RepID=UPI003D0CFF45
MTRVVDVREATTTDADALFGMASCLATSAVPDRTVFSSSLAAILTDERQLLLVAFIEGADERVGYLHGLAHPAFHANGSVAWVEELWVDEEHRRSGVGRSLMDRFESWAVHDVGAAYVALATRRAQRFYAATGYVESASYFKKNLTAIRSAHPE